MLCPHGGGVDLGAPWFARLPSTRVAHFAFQEPLSSHYYFVRAVIFAEIWRVFMVLCWPLHVFFRIKIVALRSCQQGSQFRYSRAKARASDPGTCWSANTQRLCEYGSVSLIRHTYQPTTGVLLWLLDMFRKVKKFRRGKTHMRPNPLFHPLQAYITYDNLP